MPTAIKPSLRESSAIESIDATQRHPDKIVLLGILTQGNAQLHVSLGYIEDAEDGSSEVKLFDGQHKAAAQIMLGVKEIPVRVFVNPNKDKITEANFNAGTTLKQVAFDK